MLDPRIYRMGLVPVVLAVIVVAFSLTDQPAPFTTTLAPDAYSGANAYTTMTTLAQELPRRSPGSRQDRRAAGIVARQLQANQFEVSTDTFRGTTPAGPRELENVVGTRAGQQNGSIVVIAPRDGGPGAAQLSGTAVLLELSRALSGETLQHTVILASTSGSAGGAGTLKLARSLPQPVDAAIVLGDLAGTAVRQPVLVPWANDTRIASPLLRNTVASAVAQQAGMSAGNTSLLGQLAHLTLPMAPAGQAALNEAGTPAVLISLSGERIPAAAERVTQGQITATGRAVLEAINALDTGGSTPPPSSYLIFSGKLVPAWAVRLLSLALILPVLLAAIDGVARVRRRGRPVLRWTGWVLAASLPWALAALLVRAVHGLGALTGASVIPLDGSALHLHSAQLVFLAGLACLILGAIVWLRWLARPQSTTEAPAQSHPQAEGGAAGVLLVSCLTAVVLWLTNPFAALLLIPALHLWMWVVVPDVRLPVPAAVVLVLAGLTLPVLVAVQYMLSLGLTPVQAAWSWVLLLGAGGLGAVAVISWSLFLGTAISVIALAVRDARQVRPEPVPVTVRGPLTYAGPGSLGGTESALRR